MDLNSNPSSVLYYVTLGKSIVTFSEDFLGSPHLKTTCTPCAPSLLYFSPRTLRSLTLPNLKLVFSLLSPL